MSPEELEAIAETLPIDEIPAKLRCAACNRFVGLNAFRQLCCDQSICDNCKQNLGTSCPVCDFKPLSEDGVTPHKNVRLTAKAFLRSEFQKREKIRKDQAAAAEKAATASSALEQPSSAPSQTSATEDSLQAQESADADNATNATKQLTVDVADGVGVEISKEASEHDDDQQNLSPEQTSSQDQQSTAEDVQSQVNISLESQKVVNGSDPSAQQMSLSGDQSQMMPGSFGFNPMQNMNWGNPAMFNPMMAMSNPMGFPNMMGMGMDPSMMMNNGMFGGMGMNNMNMNMGMNFNGGYGGWNNMGAGDYNDYSGAYFQRNAYGQGARGGFAGVRGQRGAMQQARFRGRGGLPNTYNRDPNGFVAGQPGIPTGPRAMTGDVPQRKVSVDEAVRGQSQSQPEQADGQQQAPEEDPAKAKVDDETEAEGAVTKDVIRTTEMVESNEEGRMDRSEDENAKSGRDAAADEALEVTMAGQKDEAATSARIISLPVPPESEAPSNDATNLASPSTEPSEGARSAQVLNAPTGPSALSAELAARGRGGFGRGFGRAGVFRGGRGAASVPPARAESSSMEQASQIPAGAPTGPKAMREGTMAIRGRPVAGRGVGRPIPTGPSRTVSQSSAPPAPTGPAADRPASRSGRTNDANPAEDRNDRRRDEDYPSDSSRHRRRRSHRSKDRSSRRHSREHSRERRHRRQRSRSPDDAYESDADSRRGSRRSRHRSSRDKHRDSDKRKSSRRDKDRSRSRSRSADHPPTKPRSMLPPSTEPREFKIKDRSKRGSAAVDPDDRSTSDPHALEREARNRERLLKEQQRRGSYQAPSGRKRSRADGFKEHDEAAEDDYADNGESNLHRASSRRKISHNGNRKGGYVEDDFDGSRARRIESEREAARWT